MKSLRFSALFLLLITIVESSLGQKLTLNDLTNLCNKKEWESVDQILIARGWTFYDSKKGSTSEYNKITWSFGKDYYTEKANGWLSLFTYEGYSNQLRYTFFNIDSYKLIQNGISTSGFKRTGSEIEDSEVITSYANANFLLKISSKKREADDYSEGSTVSYTVVVTKKASVYDEENGKKSTYWENGLVKSEYTLVNGKVHGPVTYYYSSGSVEQKGYFVNGERTGKFTDYNLDGEIVSDFSVLNGEMNGISNSYEDGKVVLTKTYVKGILNGAHVQYVYVESNENKGVRIKITGQFLNGEKNGVWKDIVEERGSQRILAFENYKNGILDGPFQNVAGDSLIIGNYLSGELHGQYKVYRDTDAPYAWQVDGSNLSKLKLLIEGNYNNGNEQSKWKYYDLTGALRKEGSFYEGSAEGQWKFYYSKNPLFGQYSEKLTVIENYHNGDLHGESTRYSYRKTEKYLCPDSLRKSFSDSCSRYHFTKVLEKTSYKNGKLNGPYEMRDSLNNVVSKGEYVNDEQVGEWVHTIVDQDDSIATIYKGSYLRGKMDGGWVQQHMDGRIISTFNYKDGKLSGEYANWISPGRPREIKHYTDGRLIDLTTYDSLGIRKKSKYEIPYESRDGFKCKWTKYLEDGGYVSQVYWVNKDKEYSHEWFELTFLLKVNKLTENSNAAFMDGEYMAVNAASKPLVTGAYNKEDKTGLWIYYFYDQGVRIEVNHSDINTPLEKYQTLNGKLYSGSFIFINESDGVKEVRSIQKGFQNGKTIFYDIKSNKVLKKEIYKNGIRK